MSSRPWTRTLGAISAAGALITAILVATTSPAPAGRPSAGADWRACLAGSPARQAVFTRAARISGVPRAVLLGVSYLESRWDDHAGSPSTAGGYGPMHLTHVVASTPSARFDRLGKGDGSAEPRVPSYAGTTRLATAQARTLDRAATMVGVSQSRLRADPVANICAGSALLASYHHGSAHGLDAWSGAVARYSTASDQRTALRFAREVYAVIREGKARTTDDGQRVRLAPHPHAARLDAAQVRSLRLTTPGHARVDCPPYLGCESVPAPYEQYGDTPGRLRQPRPREPAARPADRRHRHPRHRGLLGRRRCSWSRTRPTSAGTTRSAHPTARSRQHLDPKDVGWHAGNWYVNMHSIGIEHEGFAAQGATWYTESLYESSAALVRHLAHEYGVPLDRAHIIGHDQVPGITPGERRRACTGIPARTGTGSTT